MLTPPHAHHPAMRLRRLAWMVAICVVVCAGANGKCTVSNQRVECGSQTCDPVSGKCIACTNSSQCYESVMVCVQGECRVGSVVDTMSPETAVSMAITIVICAIAVVAGIGGGGILVPMYAALTEMPMITSVGLSQAAICGQSALNMYFVITKTVAVNNEELRPLINYQYLAILLPLSFIGTLVGSAFSKVIPDWVRLALLFTLLTAVLHRVIERAKRQFKADNIRRSGCATSTTTTADTPKLPKGGDMEEAEEEAPPSLRLPRREMVLVATGFVTLLACNIARTKLTACGSSAYLALFALPLAVLSALGWLGHKMAHVTMSNIVAGFLPPDHLTFQWNHKTTVVFPVVAVVAGAGASMLGIGGGLILSFVLYEAGLAPEEASATSGFATFMIASESALQLLFQGQLVAGYAALYSVCGLVSTLVGQHILMRYIRKYQATFLIVVALAFIVGGSLLTLTSYGIYDLVELLRNDGSLLAFGHFCKQL